MLQTVKNMLETMNKKLQRVKKYVIDVQYIQGSFYACAQPMRGDVTW